MASPKEYQAQIGALGLHELRFTASSVAEAKQELARCRKLQSELRQVKKSLNLEIKSIRVSYQDHVANAGELTGGLFSLFGKRGVAGRVRAEAKRGARRDRDAAIASYRDLKISIDELIHQLDSAKDEFQSYIEENRAAEQQTSRSMKSASADGADCPACGGRVMKADEFCRHCGVSLQEDVRL